MLIKTRATVPVPALLVNMYDVYKKIWEVLWLQASAPNL